MAECKTGVDTPHPRPAEQVKKESFLNEKNRFVPIEERRDTSVLPVDVIRNLWHGESYVIVLNSNLQDPANLRSKHFQCFMYCMRI